jgi:hypothetical protein
VPADEYPAFTSQDRYIKHVVVTRRFCEECRSERCQDCGGCLGPGCVKYRECPPWKH